MRNRIAHTFAVQANLISWPFFLVIAAGLPWFQTELKPEHSMEIVIQQVTHGDRDEWLVETLGLKVPFRDRASALAFAVRLQERVEAPHRLPEQTDLPHEAACSGD